jgi:hypothetical protein
MKPVQKKKSENLLSISSLTHSGLAQISHKAKPRAYIYYNESTLPENGERGGVEPAGEAGADSL